MGSSTSGQHRYKWEVVLEIPVPSEDEVEP